MAVYVDTSAFVKLVVAEKHSRAMRRWAEAHEADLFSSDLLVTESIRAARRHSSEAVELTRRLLDTLMIVRMGPGVFERAADLDPAGMRSLDALHVSAAMSAADQLEAVATYDERLAEAAMPIGIEVVAPS